MFCFVFSNKRQGWSTKNTKNNHPFTTVCAPLGNIIAKLMWRTPLPLPKFCYL